MVNAGAENRHTTVTLGVGDLGKPRAAAVVDQEPADQRLAGAGDQLDGFHGHEGADDARNRAQYAHGLARGQVLGIRRDGIRW